MKKYVIGVDVGTTGTKAIVVDAQGKNLGSAYRDYPFILPQENWVEVAADNLSEQVFTVVGEAIEKAGVSGDEVSAVSFSVQRSSILLVDEQGEALENRIYVWLDTRADEVLDEIAEIIPADEKEARTGMPAAPIFGINRYYWIRKKCPELYAAHKYFSTVDGYIMHKFGADQYCNEVSSVQTCGMIDVHTLDYAWDILDALGFDREKLPPLVKPGEVVGHVSEAVAKRTGLSTDTLIVAGAGDQQAGALGAGIINSGDVSITIGTSGFVIAAVEDPQFDKFPGLMVSTTPNLGVYEVEGIQNSGATCYRWAKEALFGTEAAVAESLGKDPYDFMGEYVEQSKPGSNGVIFSSALFGTGYPTWNSGASGAFIGLKPHHTRGDILRSVMEGITLEARFMLESMKENGVEPNGAIVITGGATKSPVWRQIIADVMNSKIRTLDVADASVIGVAGLAAIGSGMYASMKEVVENMVHFKDVVEPIAENVAVYDKCFKAYKAVYYALNDNGIFDMVNDITAE